MIDVEAPKATDDPLIVIDELANLALATLVFGNVTVFEDSNMVFEALKAGACGYLTKSLGLPELTKALDDLKKGGAPMSNKIAKMVIESFQLNHQDNTLT